MDENAMYESEQVAPVLRDHTVVDPAGEPVGTVKDVLYNDDLDRPVWAIVSTGLLKGDRLVPLREAYRTDEGELKVAVTKDIIKKAPKAPHDHVLTPEIDRELELYYGTS